MTIVKLIKQVKNWQSPSRDPWSNCLINSRETTKGQINYYSRRQKDNSKTICRRGGYLTWWSSNSCLCPAHNCFNALRSARASPTSLAWARLCAFPTPLEERMLRWCPLPCFGKFVSRGLRHRVPIMSCSTFSQFALNLCICGA